MATRQLNTLPLHHKQHNNRNRHRRKPHQPQHELINSRNARTRRTNRQNHAMATRQLNTLLLHYQYIQNTEPNQPRTDTNQQQAPPTPTLSQTPTRTHHPTLTPPPIHPPALFPRPLVFVVCPPTRPGWTQVNRSAQNSPRSGVFSSPGHGGTDTTRENSDRHPHSLRHGRRSRMPRSSPPPTWLHTISHT